MNNVFSYHRFLLMLRKEAADLRHKFIKTLLIAFGIGLFFFFLINYFKQIEAPESGEFEKVRLLIGTLVVLCNMLFAPFILYKRFNYRTVGVSHFMLPASQLEKWLSMFFYCIIVMPLLTIAALTLADLCLLPFYPMSGTSLWFLDGIATRAFGIMPLGFFLYLLLGQSLFFLCNIWLQSSKVQKTFAVLIIISVANGLFSRLLLELFPIADSSDMLNISVSIAESYQAGDAIQAIFGTRETWQIVSTFLTILIPMGVWYASFMKWKEQEL